ncbi:hypothetical protein CPB83DRAFT_909784 [Crepidotus variabilis]|uniref:Uncharacterized protein n=1 Tax=Crepidotus variabilis TaxID=179855 RepID=A0A9P6E9A6_9AGAR|nr:hypothetical protein CPB83DRAFT_909784 [Crepidotus variabilis]
MSGDQLRILTALAVLKTKPTEQSIFGKHYATTFNHELTRSEAYIQHLRDCFAAHSRNSITESNWKAYVHTLETEYVALKAKLDDIEAQKFLAIGSSGSMGQDAQFLSSQCTTTGQNKKGKKQVGHLSLKQINSNPSAVFVNTHVGQTSTILLQAMSKFSQLSLLQFPSGSKLSLNTFLCITRKLFLGLAETLGLLSTRIDSKAAAKVQEDLYSVISNVFTISSSWKESHISARTVITALLEQILTVLLVPLVSQLLIISQHLVEKGLKNSALPWQTFDCRPTLLALFQAALTQIQSILCPATTMAVASTKSNSKETDHRDSFSVLLVSLMLETIRQLCGALKTKKFAQVSRQHRIQRLAIKDAMWYICTITHFLLGLQERNYPAYDEAALYTDSSRPKSLELLKKAMLDDLVDLLQYQDRKRAACFAVRHLVPGVKTKGGTQLRMAGSQIPLGVTDHTYIDTSFPDDYCMLDDVEYRMFLQLVERVGQVL